VWRREEKDRLIAGDAHLQQRVELWLSPTVPPPLAFPCP
jgi:hypothetical protein